jgi:lipid-binding SYLF domain-containing protein
MCLNSILYVCIFMLEYLKCFSGLIVTLLSLSCMVKVGGELTDFIIVLRTAKAVKAFGGRAHLSLGAGMSAAAGPVGRAAEADLRAGDGGAAACYTYSCSKGAFVGVSLEYNVVATRTDTNLNFYGDAYLTATDILLGPVPQPRAAAPLYAALQSLFGKVDSITSE